MGVLAFFWFAGGDRIWVPAGDCRSDSSRVPSIPEPVCGTGQSDYPWGWLSGK